MKARLMVAALVAALPLLQGCVPLAVTGVAVGTMMAADRRTTGTYVEDENIELKSLGALKDVNGRGGHINAWSYNLRLLLTGEAPTEEVKKQAEEAVRRISSVREVTNEIQVVGASSMASRGNDALITSNVKVLTEAGTVYLMGIVSQEEGDAAVEVTRTTSGVSRVVKVFDYTK